MGYSISPLFHVTKYWKLNHRTNDNDNMGILEQINLVYFIKLTKIESDNLSMFAVEFLLCMNDL